MFLLSTNGLNQNTFYETNIFYFILCTGTNNISNNVTAQGCVAVRQMGGVAAFGCTNLTGSSNSYNLSKGEFQVGANYRYFHSWRHFVGREEQPQRQTTGGGIGTDGKDRGNAVNIYSHAVDLNFSYGLTSRIQLFLSIPYVHNERSQVLRQTAPVVDTFRYSVFARGLGDIRLGANYWIFDPESPERQCKCRYRFKITYRKSL